MSSAVSALQQRAIELAKAGDFGTEALEANRRLTELAPANEGAWTRLARCCLELSLFDDAAAALDAALRLNPQNTIARNLQLEVTRRRTVGSIAQPPPRTRAPRAARQAEPARRSVSAAFGRAEFVALGQLPPATATEALGTRIEMLLMAVSDRPFAARVVEARNRAGKSGSKLFRRNSFHPGGQGHIYAFHHGGRWEPQINLGWYASPTAAGNCFRAGIGFNTSQDGADPDREAGQERAAAALERFQRLVSSAWRQFLTDWMARNGGFIQYGDRPPATALPAADAVSWLIDTQNLAAHQWVFCGRWLFLERPEHAEILADAGGLLRWVEQTFTDLLPLWTSVYRDR